MASADYLAGLEAAAAICDQEADEIQAVLRSRLITGPGIAALSPKCDAARELARRIRLRIAGLAVVAEVADGRR